MVRGILADNNCNGQFQILLMLLREDPRRELWEFLNLATFTFHDLELAPDSSDWIVWRKCQEQQIVLITSNRNADDSDSLEAVIRNFNTAASVPVLTIADPERILRDRGYAENVADRVLDYLFDFENYRGTGRLFVP